MVCHLGSVAFFGSIPARKLKKYLKENPNAGRDGDPKDAGTTRITPTSSRRWDGPIIAFHRTKNAPRLIGFHLHNVCASGQDPQPIGSGRIDFTRVSEFWRPGQELGLELRSRVKLEDVLRPKEHVEALLAAAPGF